MPRCQRPYREWTEEQKEEHRAAARRYKREHREKINAMNRSWRAAHPEYLREYNQSYYALYRPAQLQKGRERYRENRDVILEQQRRHRAEHAVEEQRIAEEMEQIERDATRVFFPDPERLGTFTRTKRKEKIARGKNPAQTVALRLAARKGEPVLVEAEVKDVIAAARRKQARGGFTGWTHVVRAPETRERVAL